MSALYDTACVDAIKVKQFNKQKQTCASPLNIAYQSQSMTRMSNINRLM